MSKNQTAPSEPSPPQNSYRNDAYPERACDHCGQPYRGPAVYCSLACSLADA